MKEFPKYELSGWELRLTPFQQRTRLQFMNDCIHRAICAGESPDVYLSQAVMVQHDAAMSLDEMIIENLRITALRKKSRNC